MNRNPWPALPGRIEATNRPASRRLWLVLLSLLALLLLGTGVGGVYWVLHRGGPGATDPTGAERADGSRTLRPTCSDDDDPKYLEPLEFGPPIRVEFERRWLDALAGRPLPELEVYPWQPEGLVAVLGEHRMRGSLFVLSPDGKTLAIASPGDGHVRLGPLETIHEKHLWPCPGGAFALARSPDGTTLAVSCGDGDVRLVDVRDPARIPAAVVLEKPAARVTSLAYSGDGKYLLGGDPTPKRGTAWVWDLGSRKIVKQLKHIGPVLGVAFSAVPGDYRALTAGGVEDGQLHLWDALAEKETAVVDFRPTKTDATVYVGSVAFSPDGKRALSCHPDMTIRIWDVGRLEKDRELHVLKGKPPGAPAAAFSPDGRFVAAGSFEDGGVWLYDAQDGKRVRRLATSAHVHSLRFLPGGNRLVFTGRLSNDNNVHIHEVESGKEVRPPVGHLAAVNSVALAPEGRIAASGGHDWNLRLWDLDGGLQRHAIAAGQVWGVGFHPDGKRALSYGASSGILAFTDVESGASRTPGYDRQHAGAVGSAAVTRDGRYALTGGHNDGTVRMWRLRDGRQVRLFDPGPNQGSAAVTVAPDMRRAIRTGGARARLLHLRCQEVKHEWGPVAAAPFLSDGRTVFLGGKDSPLWRITPDKVEEDGQFSLSLAGMTAAHLAANDRRAAAVLAGRVAVFEAESGQELWRWDLPPHFGGVHGVALSPDGGHLLTANGDGTVYVIWLP